MQWSWTAPSFSRSSITGVRTVTSLLLRFQRLLHLWAPFHCDGEAASLWNSSSTVSQLRAKETPRHDEGQSGPSQTFETQTLESDVQFCEFTIFKSIFCVFDYRSSNADAVWRHCNNDVAFEYRLKGC